MKNEEYFIIEYKDGYLKTDAHGGNLDTHILVKLVGMALKELSRDDAERATMASIITDELVGKVQ